MSGRCVQLMSDNTTVVACLLRQGTLRSPRLMDLTVEILEFCQNHSTVLIPKHLAGSLNVLADQASRLGPVATEWSLDVRTFDWVCSLSGPFQVDLFATRENHQLPQYVSPCPDPAALEVNALSVPWSRWDSVYLFPPVALMPQVSSLLLRYQGRGALIAPFYAQSGYLPNLLRRSPDPLPLPPGHTLSQMTRDGVVFHPDPSVYRLHVWKLRRGLMSAGWDSASSDIFLLSHRESSTRQYQSVWTKFLSFLSVRAIDHLHLSVAVVCNFLAFQASVLHLQYRTVSGYRCALRLPLFWGCGFDVVTFASDQFLRGLFNFRPPSRAAPLPLWNVNVLLAYLQSPVFEPLDSIPPRLLLQKTLCLLLLASGRRIGEISHLSRSHSLAGMPQS